MKKRKTENKFGSPLYRVKTLGRSVKKDGSFNFSSQDRSNIYNIKKQSSKTKKQFSNSVANIIRKRKQNETQGSIGRVQSHNPRNLRKLKNKISFENETSNHFVTKSWVRPKVVPKKFIQLPADSPKIGNPKFGEMESSLNKSKSQHLSLPSSQKRNERFSKPSSVTSQGNSISSNSMTMKKKQKNKCKLPLKTKPLKSIQNKKLDLIHRLISNFSMGNTNKRPSGSNQFYDRKERVSKLNLLEQTRLSLSPTESNKKLFRKKYKESHKWRQNKSSQNSARKRKDKTLEKMNASERSKSVDDSEPERESEAQKTPVSNFSLKQFRAKLKNVRTLQKQRANSNMKIYSGKLNLNHYHQLPKNSSHNLEGARKKLNELKTAISISTVNKKRATMKRQKKKKSLANIQLRHTFEPIAVHQPFITDRNKNQNGEQFINQASLRLSGHVTSNKTLDLEPENKFSHRSRSNSVSDARHEISKVTSPKNKNILFQDGKFPIKNTFPQSPELRRTVGEGDNDTQKQVFKHHSTLSKKSKHTRSPSNEVEHHPNLPHLNKILKGSYFSKINDSQQQHFQSITDSVFGGAHQNSFGPSALNVSSNNQIINWNIDLVKQNTKLKKENRELRETLSQLENLVTSATDNLLKKNELEKISEERGNSLKLETQTNQNGNDSIIDQVNNFIHEISTLQTEMQSQKTYAQKIEEEVRRLKTLSYYYPAGNENVIQETLMSIDGSESKPTLSNLDFSEMRKKSKNDLPKLDDKYFESLADRSFTQSPFLVDKDDQKFSEFMLDEPQASCTPKSFTRLSKKNIVLNNEVDSSMHRSSVGGKMFGSLKTNNYEFENMFDRIEKEKLNSTFKHKRSASGNTELPHEINLGNRDRLSVPKNVDFIKAMNKEELVKETQSVPHSPVINNRLNNKLPLLSLTKIPDDEPTKNQPEPETEVKERKTDPLRDSHSPFEITTFEETTKKKPNPLRDTMHPAIIPQPPEDSLTKNNFLDKNINNLKDFMKSKKIDEDISSYIGFVIDMLKKECQQFMISGQNWKNQLDTIQEQQGEIGTKYKVLKIKYSKKKNDLLKMREKYKIFDDNLVQFKDNPKELVWEFKRLMLDNEMKSKEITFLKSRVDDLKVSEEGNN